jgi:hypothetical protein
MSTTTTIEIQGAKEIDERLKNVNRQLARTILARSLRDGLRVAQYAARATAPRRTGKLASGISIRLAKRRSNETLALKLTTSKKTYYGFYIDQGWMKAPAVYANGRFYSFNADKAKNTTNIASDKAMGGVFFAGTHFMDRAYAEASSEMLRFTLESLKKGIEDAAKG